MKTVTVAEVTFRVEGDDVIAEIDSLEMGRTTVADAIIAAKWLRVLVEHAAIPEDDA